MMTNPMPTPVQEPAKPTATQVAEQLVSPNVLAEKHAYAYYLAYCAATGTPPLSRALWGEVLQAANQQLARLLVQEGQRIALPYQLGNLIVLRRKSTFKRPSVDWQKTKATGKRVYHLNAHSDYYESFVAWEKLDCNFTYKGFFAFKPVRDVSRAIASVMQKQNGYTIYEVKPDAPPKAKRTPAPRP